MNVLKETIEYEELLVEKSTDTVTKEEYIIPDTHPDAFQIVLVDVKPIIKNKEVLQDKVFLEGNVEYNVMYLSKEEVPLVYNVVYNSKLSTYVDVPGSSINDTCDADAFVEHMDCSIVNERKFSISGIIKLTLNLYRNNSFEIIKDVEADETTQILRTPESIDKVYITDTVEMVAKKTLKVQGDIPEINNILDCNVTLHKKDVSVDENKISLSTNAQIEILYKDSENSTTNLLRDNVFLSKDYPCENLDLNSNVFSDMKIKSLVYNVYEDEVGEKRLVDVECLIESKLKAYRKFNLELINDIYSTETQIRGIKKSYPINSLEGFNTKEFVLKESININNIKSPNEVIMPVGKVSISDKKILDGRLQIEGVLDITVLFNTKDNEKSFNVVKEELPFTTSLDIPNLKSNMIPSVNISLENLNCEILGNDIEVKAIVLIEGKVCNLVQKEFLMDIVEDDETSPSKNKSSITIYIIQPKDTLWKISKKYHVTTDDIKNLNSMEDNDNLTVGEKLLIPGRALF